VSWHDLFMIPASLVPGQLVDHPRLIGGDLAADARQNRRSPARQQQLTTVRRQGREE
jgi:hypothetical protein